MSTTVFLQIFFNIVVFTFILMIFARLRRPAKDDPRLSKGLQMLSSKIAILEDLNDRTERQVQQMLNLLDQKSKELQQKIAASETQVQQIKQSMHQSMEVAQIFQDKIPHSEIIERQNSMKYIQAARLAHQGYSIDQILREVDLPRGEVEFIAKVNKEQLTFREEELPAWAQSPMGESAPVRQSVMQIEKEPPLPASGPPATSTAVSTALEEQLALLGQNFRKAQSSATVKAAPRNLRQGEVRSREVRAFEFPRIGPEA